MKSVWIKLTLTIVVVFVLMSLAMATSNVAVEASTQNPIATSESAGLLFSSPTGNEQFQSPPQITEPTWGEAFLRGLQRKDFIGYSVALCLSIIALFLKQRRIRYLILIGSIIYLGFVTGLRLSGLGGPSTLILTLLGTHGSVKINTPWYMLWGFIFIFGLVAGRTFCGWVCPMGALQQFLFQRKLEVKTSQRVHRWLRYSRYVVLLALVVSVLIIPAGYWGHSDPFRALYRWDWEIVPAILLGIVLLVSLFIFTPWCKYVCPLGTVLSIFSKISLFKVRVNDQVCTDCKRCSRMDCQYLAITGGEKGVKPKINDLECTSCGECIAKCPDAAISLNLPGRLNRAVDMRRIKYVVASVMAAVIIVIFVGAAVLHVPTSATTPTAPPTAVPTTVPAPKPSTSTEAVPTATAEPTTTDQGEAPTIEPSNPAPTTTLPSTTTDTEPTPPVVPESMVMTELGIEIANITPTIAADAEIFITVRTLPGATVFLQLVNPYTGTRSAWPKPVDGGKIRVADDEGMATWSWTLYKMVGKGEGMLEFLVTSSTDQDYVAQWKSGMTRRDMDGFAQNDDTILVEIPFTVVKSNY